MRWQGNGGFNEAPLIFPVSFHVRFVHMTKHQCRIKYYTSKKGTGSKHALSSVQSLSCDLMDCSIPGFPVHQQLLGLTQTHAHWIGDATQPSHPLLSPSPPAFNLSQHQGLFKCLFFVSGGVSVLASVLPMNIQDWFPLGRTGWISLMSKGLWRVFSNRTVQKHQFFGT